MANKRIKDLSTTAAVTASDDFIAVDGATNGTRKLNAFSPTFGGNLTVSGTGTSSVAGNLGVGTTSPDSYAARVLQINDTSVSTSSSIKLTNNTTGATKDDGFDLTVSGSNALLIQRENAYIGFYANATETMRLFANGNLFVGASPVDSANGKLQLATHTTSAGGIGFGTNMSLFKGTGNGAFYFDDNSGANNTRLFIQNGGVTKALFETYNAASAVYIGSAAAGFSTVIYSGNSSTALTLDSSQRCILAGALRLNNAYTASAVVPTGYVTIQDSTGTTYKVCVLL